MASKNTSVWIGAAECARRTGLTVRTLRLYEESGLIEPVRSVKGWRRYGPEALQRLNVIVTLKAFGLTLEQIRTQLATNPPPLARVLQMQLESSRARREAADKAVRLIGTALVTLDSGKDLSLEDLCELAKGMDMENAFARLQTYRVLANAVLTPDEERTVMTWVASQPAEAMKARAEAVPAARALIGTVRGLLQNNVAPTAPEAQALAVAENEIALRYGLRDFAAALFVWNAPLADKWLQMSERFAWTKNPLAESHENASAKPAAPPIAEEGVRDYLIAIQAASPWHRALAPIVDEAARLADRDSPPTAAKAQTLATRVRKICADHALGDPLIYVRWANVRQFRWSSEDVAQKRKGWTFLATALEAGAQA